MLTLRVIVVFQLFVSLAFGQGYPATKVYSDLREYVFENGYPNDLGFQFVAATHVYVSDTFVPPGLLVQVDEFGEVLGIDTLRNYKYRHTYKVDSLLLMSAYHFNKYPDTLATWVFELCDLQGNVLYWDDHDMLSCSPGWSGVAELNDSIYVLVQFRECFNSVHESVYYYINKNILAVSKEIKPGGFNGNILRIDDQPRYLAWLSVDIWLMDSTFRTNNKIKFDTITPSQGGTMLPREDKPGWFGFGGCHTPTNFHGLCMIAFDDKLNVDKLDVIYHPPSGNWYIPASYQSMCRQANGYYVSGQWNVTGQANWWFEKSPSEVVIAKYDENLDRVWTKIVGGDRRYWPTGIYPTLQGGIMVAGGLIDVLDDYKKVPFTMYFDADGEVVGTRESTPGHYAFTIYGNPGREALRIMSQFDSGQATLLVVDAMGRPVLQRQLVDGMNEYETAFWPSGTYLMSITDHHGRVLWSQPWIRQ
jgi:hypothetical protein